MQAGVQDANVIDDAEVPRVLSVDMLDFQLTSRVLVSL